MDTVGHHSVTFRCNSVTARRADHFYNAINERPK
jgi:hypothetical protein